ncbi:MAG: hypothetical protein M3069_19835 [Chloroflexota bacterium]|nr:hypothetical protein [Chloroflexota bacterium]
MAVSALPRSRARTPLKAATLPRVVLALALVPPALDLLAAVQRSVVVPNAGLLAASVAAAALLVAWAHFPRTSWLAAASLAAVASLALRIVGADLAAGLSLLTVVALGIGGAFASAVAEPEGWLAEVVTSRS